eukprot:468881-Prymnesium_polylepis.1
MCQTWEAAHPVSPLLDEAQPTERVGCCPHSSTSQSRLVLAAIAPTNCTILPHTASTSRASQSLAQPRRTTVSHPQSSAESTRSPPVGHRDNAGWGQPTR